jgi:hypothetical protein
MRTVFALVGSMILAAGVAGPAFAETAHTTEDVTGAVLVCDAHTYTLVAGSILIVSHESTDANGGRHETFTATPSGVKATDEDGTIYRLVGAQWGGDNATPAEAVGTFTNHLAVVAPGQGIVDWFRYVEHAGPGGSFTFNLSTCEG